MGDCYELLFQFLTSQQSMAHRLQQEELERLRNQRQDPPPDPFSPLDPDDDMKK